MDELKLGFPGQIPESGLPKEVATRLEPVNMSLSAFERVMSAKSRTEQIAWEICMIRYANRR
jgi:hypothetical protein